MLDRRLKAHVGTQRPSQPGGTHTKDKKEATNAETPATMVMARARLEPVPPAAVVMLEIREQSGSQPRVVEAIPTHAAPSIKT